MVDQLGGVFKLLRRTGSAILLVISEPLGHKVPFLYMDKQKKTNKNHVPRKVRKMDNTEKNQPYVDPTFLRHTVLAPQDIHQKD